MSQNAAGKSPVEEKMEYLHELWRECCEERQLVRSPSALVSLHTILQLLADEARNHALRSDGIRHYILKTLGSLLKDSPPLTHQIASDIRMILREMNSGRTEFLRQLAERVLFHFGNGSYFRALHEALKGITLRPSWDTGDSVKLRVLTQQLVIEFLLRSYDLKTVEHIGRNIFDDWSDTHGRVFTFFPTGISPSDFEHDGEMNQDAFNSAVKTKMESLSAEDRLDAIRAYYETAEHELTFLFDIQGLTGEKFDLQLGCVNLYSPQVKCYLIEAEFRRLEKLAGKEEKPAEFARAAVKIKCFDTDGGKRKAIEQIESALDLVRCFYRPRASFQILGGTYIAGSDRGGVGWGQSIEDDDVAYRKLEGLNLDNYNVSAGLERALPKFPEFVFSNPGNQTVSERKVNYSLHWYRKGAESSRFEDRILCYWIAIEHLFENDAQVTTAVEKKVLDGGKIGLIMEIYSSLYIRSRLFELGWDFRRELEAGFRYRQIRLPPELAAEAQLTGPEGQLLELRKFIAKLSEIATYVHRRAVTEEIDYHIALFGPVPQSRSMVRALMEQTADELLLIYRYRNKIVHNAQFADPLLIYFAGKAEQYAGWFVRQAIRWVVEQPHVNLNAVMCRAYAEGKSFLAAMEGATTHQCIDILLSPEN